MTKCALFGIEGELDDIAAVGQNKRCFKTLFKYT
ncbi:hypothetical protein QBX69_05510 [Rickettsia rickettsii str. 'Sheila Smith']|nr:hypothetical protein [Rickettsia rickettsii]WGQ96172.1 hypothetical protein QBX69_05510 [Rickettsia rickettsii str. 'Sheila Smith']